MQNFGMNKEIFKLSSFLDWYNTLVGGAVTLLAAVFGKHWYIFVAFAFFNIVDYLSGWYKARKTKTEDSKIGLSGIIKKLWYWVIVALAFVVASIISTEANTLLGINLQWLSLIGWFTLASLAVNELRSICENLVAAGINIPSVFTKGLAVAQKLIEDKATSVLPDTEQKE